MSAVSSQFSIARPAKRGEFEPCAQYRKGGRLYARAFVVEEAKSIYRVNAVAELMVYCNLLCAFLYCQVSNYNNSATRSFQMPLLSMLNVMESRCL